jgi:penicillin-binding protein 1A
MPVAGKTGTTTMRLRPLVLRAITPYYTGAVWCGYDDPEEVVLSDSETNPAIVLWKDVMAAVHENLPEKDFTKPSNVVECSVCKDSGLLPTDACRNDPRGSRVVTVELSI